VAGDCSIRGFKKKFLEKSSGLRVMCDEKYPRSLKDHELGLLRCVLRSMFGPDVSSIIALYIHTPDMLGHLAALREPLTVRTERWTLKIRPSSPAFMTQWSCGQDSWDSWEKTDARALWNTLHCEIWQRDFAAFLVVVNRMLTKRLRRKLTEDWRALARHGAIAVQDFVPLNIPGA
jgi:hypothetical protein